MNTGENFTKISRDEINEAMARFFSKGGKIKKIKTMHNSISTIDPLANQEGSNWDEFSNLNLGSGLSSSLVGNW